MKIIYKSDDSKEFDTKEDCIKHEKEVTIKSAVSKILESCYEYSDDANFYVLVEEICIDAIVKNIEYLNNIVNENK